MTISVIGHRDEGGTIYKMPKCGGVLFGHLVQSSRLQGMIRR